MHRTVTTAALGGLLLAACPLSATASPGSPSGGELLSRPLASILIQGYQQERAAGATGQDRPLRPLDPRRYSPGLLQSLSQEKARIKDLHQKADGRLAYDRGVVLVGVKDVKRTGDTATVTSRDVTRLHLRGAGIALGDYTTAATRRSYTFKQVGGRWQLTGVKEIEGLTPQARAEAGAAATDVLTPLPGSKPRPGGHKFTGAPDSPEVTARLKGGGATNAAATSYDRSKASAYAWRHVFFHNDKQYPTWGGADCTNFASQVLAAGGWANVGKGKLKPNDPRAWYYSAPGAFPSTRQVKTSISWINAQKFSDFLRANPGRVVEYRNPDNAKVGDIVQFRWSGMKRISHSAVVTGVTPWGLYVTYHTSDKLNESLNLITLRDPGAKVYFFSPR